ncbi:MAG: ParB N-terminal domain-containing protein, partial [Phycisphaerae bacterium]
MIDPDPDQPRRTMDREPLEQLADSIRMHGLLQPVIVYESG